jgi:hypothetical protein
MNCLQRLAFRFSLYIAKPLLDKAVEEVVVEMESWYAKDLSAGVGEARRGHAIDKIENTQFKTTSDAYHKAMKKSNPHFRAALGAYIDSKVFDFNKSGKFKRLIGRSKSARNVKRDPKQVERIWQYPWFMTNMAFDGIVD